MTPRIENTQDLKRIKSLLALNTLPTADIEPNGSIRFRGIFDGDTLIAVIGLERHGSHGLIRSLVVSEPCRGRGLARALVRDIEGAAVREGISTLFLLTTTARNFFEHLGYRVIARCEAPEAIAATGQLAGLCPASATLMRRDLV